MYLPRQRNLDIPAHRCLRFCPPCGHFFNLFDLALTRVKPRGDFCREEFDLLLLFVPVVVEAGENVLLVEFVERGAVLGDAREDVGNFVGYVAPPRGEEVHFDHGVGGGGVQAARGEEALSVIVAGREGGGLAMAGAL